ncbi:MAG: Coenzyme F420 hydrogenase/dehydrogenase, beta subunit C-terminal domain [Candidatus Aenigmarchaeota archaeon]|nr:Coenzyme F420 hydrogenase/dehydrogenase, beta subunit C-terminal domain [Candidatus Aenigmarchaeota archaeon]
MRVFENKNRCSGCTACMHSCPVKAISMKTDEEGFDYPDIDQKKCINCGTCRKICPFNNKLVRKDLLNAPDVLAAKNKNEETRISSSSGGVFSVLAEHVLSSGRVVYGAAFDNDFIVKHIRISNKNEIIKLKGSKYVQSDLSDVFLQVERDFKQNKQVLFSGTPCQVAGLRAYFNNVIPDKIILVDLVCHGVPSPLVWKEYVNVLQTKMKSKLTSFSFRDKKTGWHNSKLYAEFENHKPLFKNSLLDSFNDIFYKHVALRPSCHSCVFANYERTGDITLADFWGIEKYNPKFDDNKGVSLVLLNTNKGKRIFNAIRDGLVYENRDKRETEQNSLLYKPTSPSNKRDAFWKDFGKHGYEYVAKKYTGYGIIIKMKRIFKKLLGKS